MWVGRFRGQSVFISGTARKKLFHDMRKRASLLHSCLIRASTKMKSNNTPIALLLLLAVASTAFATKCSDHLLSLKSSDGQDSYGKCQQQKNSILLFLLQIVVVVCRVFIVHLRFWQFRETPGWCSWFYQPTYQTEFPVFHYGISKYIEIKFNNLKNNF